LFPEAKWEIIRNSGPGAGNTKKEIPSDRDTARKMFQAGESGHRLVDLRADIRRQLEQARPSKTHPDEHEGQVDYSFQVDLLFPKETSDFRWLWPPDSR
jgi:hypothetical protein